MIINLGHRLPDASSDLPEGSDGQPSNAFLFGLAPGGVYRAFDVTIEAVSSYLAFSPLPCHGGVFSVALSLGSPPLRVTEHHALRSSDFPLVLSKNQRSSVPLRPN